MTRAIIWDLDDTLYSERSFAFSGFTAVATAFENRLGAAEIAAQRMRDLFDHGDRRRIFDTILRERRQRADADVIAAMIQVYRTHPPAIRLHEDAERALARLRGRYRFGLISDGPKDMQRGKVSALRLEERLDEIILTDELPPGHGKPDPLAFELMMSRLSLPPEACTYVSDNVAKDFVAPNRLGWGTVCVVREDGIYRGARAAVGGAARATITTLDNLDGVLDVAS